MTVDDFKLLKETNETNDEMFKSCLNHGSCLDCPLLGVFNPKDFWKRFVSPIVKIPVTCVRSGFTCVKCIAKQQGLLALLVVYHFVVSKGSGFYANHPKDLVYEKGSAEWTGSRTAVQEYLKSLGITADQITGVSE